MAIRLKDQNLETFTVFMGDMLYSFKLIFQTHTVEKHINKAIM